MPISLRWESALLLDTNLLEGLIQARYSHNKLPQLELLNTKLDVLRHQTRLLLDFELLRTERYEYEGQQLNAILPFFLMIKIFLQRHGGLLKAIWLACGSNPSHQKSVV